jgi:curved DNA-binding protein CbpA
MKMDKLTDPNPYEILGINPNADKQQIKLALAERQRGGADQASRQKALTARKVLSSLEKRLFVDSLLPDFGTDLNEDALLEELRTSNTEVKNWEAYLDEETVLTQDLQALIAATLRYTCNQIPLPFSQPPLSPEFDGLEDFLNEWLK